MLKRSCALYTVHSGNTPTVFSGKIMQFNNKFVPALTWPWEQRWSWYLYLSTNQALRWGFFFSPAEPWGQVERDSAGGQGGAADLPVINISCLMLTGHAGTLAQSAGLYHEAQKLSCTLSISCVTARTPEVTLCWNEQLSSPDAEDHPHPPPHPLPFTLHFSY